MELSWSTFLLEILNFLVLVWLLKRFFYRPLQSVIARRQQDIDARLASAEEMQRQAQQLQRDYESRLQDWRNERQKLREASEQELKQERLQREQKLVDDLKAQRQKAQAVDERSQREQQRQLEVQALEQGGRFASRLLQEAAGAELEERLLQLIVDDLATMTETQRATLLERIPVTVAKGDGSEKKMVQVASAFPLPVPQRQRVEDALQQTLDRTLHCHFVEDPELIAGLCITLGPWQLGLNVRDELRGFAQLAPDPRAQRPELQA